MTIETIAAQLTIDEGSVSYAYQDSLGYWTIGVGTLIDKRKGGGLRPNEIQYILYNRIAEALDNCTKLYPKFGSFSNSRQDALANLMFNMGLTTMSSFHNTVAAINEGKWSEAQEGLRNSLWYKQVGARADRIIAALAIS